MNINQRLHQLEQVLNPALKDTRQPLLLEFIGTNSDSTGDDWTGILYTYGAKVTAQNLTKQELEQYQNKTQTVQIEDIYKREPNFRTV